MTFMFQTWLSCLEHKFHVLNMNVMFSTWWSCSEQDSHVPIHDVYVLKMKNMIVMYWNKIIVFRTRCSSASTWHSRVEYDLHVQNINVMFRTWPSCSKHDIHVLNTKIMFEHVSSCSEHDRTWLEHSWCTLSMNEHNFEHVMFSLMFGFMFSAHEAKAIAYMAMCQC